MRHWLRAHGWLLGVLSVASFAMLFRLSDRPIENWDEGIHGEVSFEMVEGGDWLTPHYMGGTYFRKPPLKLWMSAVLFKGFGVNAWTLRLPSALAGIATSMLVAWWMWEWRRNRWEAFLAGVIVATMRPIFFHAFRTGEMDGVLTFFIVAALYCWWRAVPSATQNTRVANAEWRMENGEYRNHNSSFIIHHSSFRWLALCGATIGLAVMTKSAAGLLPLPIIAVHALLTGSWKHFRFREFFILTSSFFILVAPWHLTMTALHGMTFWNDYIGWHVIKRATEVLHNETAGTWWYIPTLAKRFTPYTYWFVPALCLQFILSVAAAKRRISPWRHRDAMSTPRNVGEILRRCTPQDKLGPLLVTWFFIGFLGFSASRTKFDWYLLPIYPAAVMLTVVFFSTAREAVVHRSFAFLHLAALVIAATALPSLHPPGTRLDVLIERWYRPFGHPLVVATFAVIFVIVLVRWLAQRFGPDATGRIVTIAGTACALVLGATVTARHLMMSYPTNPSSTIVETIRGSNGALVGYGLDYQQMPAGYFILRSELRDDVRVLDGQLDVARTTAMLRERERGFLLTKREAELPQELRQIVGNPRSFGDFALWERQ